MACSSSVGPCCGLLAIDESLGVACSLREFVVCHVCFSGTARSLCAWSPPVPDFPRMNAQQAYVWHQLRGDFVWQAVLDEQGSRLSHPESPSLAGEFDTTSAAGCTAGANDASEDTVA